MGDKLLEQFFQRLARSKSQQVKTRIQIQQLNQKALSLKKKLNTLKAEQKEDAVEEESYKVRYIQTKEHNEVQTEQHNEHHGNLNKLRNLKRRIQRELIIKKNVNFKKEQELHVLQRDRLMLQKVAQ